MSTFDSKIVDKERPSTADHLHDYSHEDIINNDTIILKEDCEDLWMLLPETSSILPPSVLPPPSSWTEGYSTTSTNQEGIIINGFTQQENQTSFDEELILITTNYEDSYFQTDHGRAHDMNDINCNQVDKISEDDNCNESAMKKLNHNAKERARRMKLNASYLALHSLLPSSRRSKKKWSAPVIVSKVLEYIPEMEKEIEKLIQRKDQLLLLSMAQKRQQDDYPSVQADPVGVSLTEVKEDEVIVQICMQRKKGITTDDHDVSFSKLLSKVEGEGLCIISASLTSVCDDRVCCHLHLQHIKGSSSRPNHAADLKDKIVSWCMS